MNERKVVFLKTCSTGDYFTAEEAADYLSVKAGVVRNYLWEGKFTTYKFKSLTLLERKELDKYRSL